MIIQKGKGKFRTFLNVIKFVYGRYPSTAITRDILSVISTLATVYSITVLGRFIDEVAQILLDWKSFNLFDFYSSQAFTNLLLIFALWAVIQAINQINSHFYDIIYERIWEDAKYMMIDKVSMSDLQDVEREDFQDLLTYVPSYSIDRIVYTYNSLSTIVGNVISVCSAFFILWETMGWSVLFLLLITIPQIIVVHLGRKRIREYQGKEVGRWKFLNYLNNLALTISNFSELRVNNIYRHVKRMFKEDYDKYEEGYLEYDKDFFRNRSVVTIVGQGLKIMYVIYVLSVAIVKRLTVGTFKALYDYVDLVYTSIYSIFDSISYISNLLGYDEKFFALINYEGFGDHEHGSVKLLNRTPSLEFKNLTFSYPDDPKTYVLKNINIKIEPGEKIAFFGGDGSGKSSMVKILTGLYEVKGGDFLVDGHPIQDLDRGQLKKKIAVTFQNFVEYSFSLRENVVIAGERQNINEALYNDVMRHSLVSPFMRKYQIKDSQILGKTFPGGRDLSPGYWQKLAIARMLYRDRKIFIMDEAFTFIDSESKDDIMRNIFSFVGTERTLIYITRTIDNLDLFDKIFVFDNGRITETGSWKELMKNNGKFAQIAKENM